MSERLAIIHVGTHKTGTTSLQFFFELNKDRFQPAGVYVAQAGRYGRLPGNHQIAWELLSSNTSKHFDDLVAELRSRAERTALISSEDLCLLYARPEALMVLREGIISAGFLPTVVVYFRAQAPYAASMYAERIKHGYVRSVRSYLETILRDGRYVPDGSPIHIEFEYTRMLSALTRAFGQNGVIARPYVQTADPVHIFRDFLGIMGSLDRAAFETQLGLIIPSTEENPSLTLYELLEHAYEACDIHAVTGATCIDAIFAVAPGISEAALHARARLLLRDEVVAIAERFAGDNECLANEFSLALSQAGVSDIAAADDPVWETARIQRALFDQLLEDWLTRKDANQPQPK